MNRWKRIRTRWRNVWPVNARHLFKAFVSTNFHCKNAVTLVRPFSKLIYVRNFGRCRADNLNQTDCSSLCIGPHCSSHIVECCFAASRRCHIQLRLIRKYVTSFGISLFSVINVVVLSSMFIGFYIRLPHHVFRSVLFLIPFQTRFWSDASVSYRWVLIISLGCDCLVAVNSLSICFFFFLIFIYFCFDFFSFFSTFFFALCYKLLHWYSILGRTLSVPANKRTNKTNSNTTDETKFIGWNQNGYKCVLGDKLFFSFSSAFVYVMRILFWTNHSPSPFRNHPNPRKNSTS